MQHTHFAYTRQKYESDPSNAEKIRTLEKRLATSARYGSGRIISSASATRTTRRIRDTIFFARDPKRLIIILSRYNNYRMTNIFCPRDIIVFHAAFSARSQKNKTSCPLWRMLKRRLIGYYKLHVFSMECNSVAAAEVFRFIGEGLTNLYLLQH